MRGGTDETVEAELDRLQSMPIAGLRRSWQEVFRTAPPSAFGPDLLRRSLAQKIQETAYGGLSPTIRRLLDRLAKSMGSKPHDRIELPRRIKPGAVLVREWKGKIHRVMVLEEGFAHEGNPYPSLSEVARVITGTRWNGPRFFGLRAAPLGDAADDANPSKSKMMRSSKGSTPRKKAR